MPSAKKKNSTFLIQKIIKLIKKLQLLEEMCTLCCGGGTTAPTMPLGANNNSPPDMQIDK